VLAFQGETEPGFLEGLPHAWVKLGEVGRAIDLLHRAEARDIVMIGPIRRPSLSQLKLDRRGAQLLTRLGWQVLHGDDRLLRTLVEELEREGFRVIGVDDLIQPLLADLGAMTERAPDDDAWTDIRHGIMVARRLGELDIGQAVVLQQGLVLGVEAAEGTDRLLARCAELRREGRGGVLVKLKKPGQERRVDLPTVGPDTVGGAAAAGLIGIAVEAGQCLIVDRPKMIAAADAQGLFLVGIEAGR
jgi:hypothetical protein